MKDKTTSLKSRRSKPELIGAVSKLLLKFETKNPIST